MQDYGKYKHQQKIIQRHYNNLDTISLQRAQELITDLYLSEGKKREKNWDSLELHLGRLGVTKETMAHLRKQDKPELVASLVTKLFSSGSLQPEKK